jgi:hypothetical protein
VSVLQGRERAGGRAGRTVRTRRGHVINSHSENPYIYIVFLYRHSVHRHKTMYYIFM